MSIITTTYDKVSLSLEKHKETLDIICGILLALCPILQHYKGLLFNSAITILVIIVPYLIMRLLPKLKDFCFSMISIVLVMIIYQIYRIINHGTSVTEFGQSTVFIIYMIAISMSCVNLNVLLKAARVVSLIAAICLVLQYITFYLFGFHIQFVPTGLLISSADQWILGAQTGLAGITGVMRDFYRPSAFFLEPSHAYLYMFPHLILLLFDEKFDKKVFTQVVILSLGLVLSTSGMGIAVVIGSWGLFFMFRDKETGTFKIKNILKRNNLIAVAIFIVVFIIVAIKVPFIGRSVKRIFTAKSGITAISGRISGSMEAVRNMNIKQLLFGIADTTQGMKFNIPGFFGALFRHGIIGVVLSYEFYVKSLFKLNLAYAILAAVIIVTSFFSAHTHSTVGMLYYIFILMSGFQISSYDNKNSCGGDKCE